MKCSRLIKALRCAVWLLALVMPWSAFAQGFTLVILDEPGAGFLDPAMRMSDIDGQMTTLGQDRIDCFIAAMTVWTDHLDINTTINIDLAFESLGGNQNSAVLAGTNPKVIFHSFFNAPVSLTWFTVAEANQIAGLDLDPDPQRIPSTVFDDIDAVFNSDIDDTCDTCALGATTWYYGIDGNPPPGKIDFFSTVMHEMGHGLGFFSKMDFETGELWVELDDIFTSQLRREGTVNKNYTDMTNIERAEANVSGEVVWNGAAVAASEGAPQPIYAPNPLEEGSSIFHWAPTVILNDQNLLLEPFKTEPFTNLTLERAAFEDLFWPLIPFDRDNVYVDFAFTRFGFGTLADPFNTAAKALNAANLGANIFFAAGTTSETGTFSEASIWQSTGGTVTFGVP